MSESSTDGEEKLVTGTDPDGRKVITLRGEIDLSDVDDLSTRILAAVDPADNLVFDLSGVDFMDSSGIALLLDTVNSVADAEIRSPSRQVRRVLEASGLSTVLRIVP